MHDAVRPGRSSAHFRPDLGRDDGIHDPVGRRAGSGAPRVGAGTDPALVPYVLPNALRFAVPAAILFSACSVYGRMSAANEIVAVKSLGISPMALLWPGLALSFLISLSAVWLNDLAASWGREGIQRVIMDSVEQIVYGTLRTHRSHRASDRLAITVRRVDGRKLIQPTITTQDARGRSMTITAREAELQSRPEHNALMLRLWDPVIESGDRGRLTWPGVLEQEIPLRDATKGADQGKHPADYALRQIPDGGHRPAKTHPGTATVVGDDRRLPTLDGRLRRAHAPPIGRTDIICCKPATGVCIRLQLGTLATLGQRIQLLLLRVGRRPVGGAAAKFGPDDQLRPGISPHPAAVLPAHAVRRRPGQDGGISPLLRLVGQCHPVRRRHRDVTASPAVLKDRRGRGRFALPPDVLLEYTPASVFRRLATRRSHVLARWPIRYKMYLGGATLWLMLALLAFSGLRGPYAYKHLAWTITQRSAEIPRARRSPTAWPICGLWGDRRRVDDGGVHTQLSCGRSGRPQPAVPHATRRSPHRAA